MEKINKKIIGIIGPAGSGKSTLAKLLWRNLPCTSICSFAEPLRRMLQRSGSYSNPWKKIQCDNYMAGVPVTSALIALGKYFRETYGKDVIIKMMEKEIEDTMSLITTIVIDDVRMPEELAWLKKQGAIIIVLMPSLEKKPDEIPETEKLTWEIVENKFPLSYIDSSEYVFFCYPDADGEMNFEGIIQELKLALFL